MQTLADLTERQHRHISRCPNARPCPQCTWWHCGLIPCDCTTSAVYRAHRQA